MAQPTSKATFAEFCLRKLGKPVIEINIDDDISFIDEDEINEDDDLNEEIIDEKK